MISLPPLRRKERKPPKRKVDNGRGRLKCPKHLAWVRKHMCVAHFTGQCSGATHAHHVKTRGAGGGDDQVVSICAIHHNWIHTQGRHTFEADFFLDLEALAKAFADKSPFLRNRNG